MNILLLTSSCISPFNLFKLWLIEYSQYVLFFANIFLFSIKGICYSILMQFTIHCPPNLMARIYNIGTWCTQLLTDLHKKWTQLLVSLPLLALILLHTLSPYKSNNLSLSLSNAHVSDTRALVIVKNWSKPEIVGQTDDVGQSGHWPLRECPFVHHLVVRQNNSNDHSSNIINNNDDGSSNNNNN